MKPEAFDEAIRKKLESIGQSYTDADIDQVFRHVVKPKPPLLRWFKGKWYIPVIAGMVVVTTLLFTREDPVVKTPVKGPSNITSVRKDAESVPETSLPVSPEAGEPSSRTMNHDKPVQTEAIAHVELPMAVKQAASLPAKPARVKEQLKQEGEEPSPGIANNAKAVVIKETNESIQQEEQPALVEKQPAEELAPPMPAIEPEQQDSPETPAAVVPASSQVQEGGILQKKADQKNKISWGYQVTAAPFVSNQALGAGISGGLTAGKHFGFSAGIRYFRTYPENFRDREDLDRRNHHRMHPRIEEGFKEDDKFRDIVMRNELLQAPIRFSYRIPVKRGLELSFGLGTDLDFYLNQSVELRLQEDSAGRPRRPFQARGEISPMNNLVLTAGIRKQWNRFSVYLSPYLSPSLKEVFYKPKKMEVGGEVGILFDLH